MYNNEQEIKDFLMAKSMEANVEPVFEDPNNGIEIRLDEKSTFVLNQILEQAFIPYLAKCLAEAGYHTEKITED